MVPEVEALEERLGNILVNDPELVELLEQVFDLDQEKPENLKRVIKIKFKRKDSGTFLIMLLNLLNSLSRYLISIGKF